jgi:hypothetical protein
MLQKHLKLVIRKDDAWATPPEIPIRFLIVGTQGSYILVKYTMGEDPSFHPLLEACSSNITSTTFQSFPWIPALCLSVSFSLMHRYLPAALQVTLLWELTPWTEQKPHLCLLNRKTNITFNSVFYARSQLG